MQFTWPEIDQLAALLEAEARDLPIDAAEMGRLAMIVAAQCPEIAGTMHRIVRRIASAEALAA